MLVGLNDSSESWPQNLNFRGITEIWKQQPFTEKLDKRLIL